MASPGRRYHLLNAICVSEYAKKHILVARWRSVEVIAMRYVLTWVFRKYDDNWIVYKM